MPRSLTFTIDSNTLDAQLIKVDRRQLYGSVSVETRDTNNAVCRLVTLAEDGKTIIPKGGTALGYINPDGEWVSRNELKPVDLQGNPVAEVDSSFDNPIVLKNTCTIEHFLNHSVRLSYQLKPEKGFSDSFITTLRSGTVFEFGFSYRGGVGHDPAFVMCDDDDNVWLLITEANDVQFVSLQQAAVCAGEALVDEVEDPEVSASLDFGML